MPLITAGALAGLEIGCGGALGRDFGGAWGGALLYFGGFLCAACGAGKGAVVGERTALLRLRVGACTLAILAGSPSGRG